ncbi:MAG: helix-turn-helix transcriptional regulator [Candidatus Saccharimonadales bacterium]
MDKQNQTNPFQPLGKQLRVLRNRVNETLAEASGAVEIDVRQLANFELGHSRPTEDVLLLLISHFGAKDDEAVSLWEMAGYGMDKIPAAHMVNEQPQMALDTVSGDSRILFTDIVDVIVNNYGVVMNFMQSSGPKSSPTAVSRVGMSREHAKSVLQILQVTLSQTERSVSNVQKRLATPDSPDETSRN